MRGGVASHDVGQAGVSLFDPNRVRDVNAELLFSLPGLSSWALIGEVRPHAGASFNVAGQGGFGYAGLSWTIRAPVIPVFVEAGLGLAVQGDVAAKGPKRFGCAAQLEAQASAGVDILPNVALMASVQHVSDFGVCGQASNAMTNAGLRLGVRF